MSDLNVDRLLRERNEAWAALVLAGKAHVAKDQEALSEILARRTAGEMARAWVREMDAVRDRLEAKLKEREDEVLRYMSAGNAAAERERQLTEERDKLKLACEVATQELTLGAEAMRGTREEIETLREEVVALVERNAELELAAMTPEAVKSLADRGRAAVKRALEMFDGTESQELEAERAALKRSVRRTLLRGEDFIPPRPTEPLEQLRASRGAPTSPAGAKETSMPEASEVPRPSTGVTNPTGGPNDDLDNWFRYHSPAETAERDGITVEEVGKRYERLREAGRQMALVIRAETPRSADQSAALRLVREAVFAANAAIACGGK